MGWTPLKGRTPRLASPGVAGVNGEDHNGGVRTISLTENGGPDVLTLVEVATPDPGPGQIRVRLEAAGVNFIDVYHREGAYPLPLPFTPGQEGAGVVDAVGAGVEKFQPGDRVCWAMSGGSYAEYAVVDEDRLAAIPDSIDSHTAAASMLQGLTAHYLVTSVYPVTEGTITVVHAVAGGVGLLLTQMIKARGGIVIGTTSTAEKAKRAESFGADHVIRYDQVNWAQQVEDIVGAHSVDVVYDGVGKDTFEAGLGLLRPRGTMALFGASSGQVPPFDLQRLSVLGSLVVTRPSLGHFITDADEFSWRVGELFTAIAEGALTVSIAQTFDLAEAADAHRAIQSRNYSGKILLTT